MKMYKIEDVNTQLAMTSRQVGYEWRSGRLRVAVNFPTMIGHEAIKGRLHDCANSKTLCSSGFV